VNGIYEKTAKILSFIRPRIDANNQIKRNLTNQFVAIVDDFVYHLDSFELKRLDDVAECQNGRAFYKEGYDEKGAFVIDLGNVNTSANFVYTNADKYVSLERYEQDKLANYRVYKDDLVMVMTDRKSTMDLLGKTGKVYKEGYYLLNQRMYRIRAKEGMNINYLYAILNSTRVCNGLKEKALGSVQKYVNTKEINEIEILVPSPEKMYELSEIVNPISTQMETNILENEILSELRDALLPRLMSGELDVSSLDI
jgi:type I restriction enzyme S subunit